MNTLIKKPGSDKNILNNYRPISQLTAFSKLLEQIVFTQIISHLLAAKVLHPHQSAYMPGLSTETALCRINDDVLNNKTGSLMLFLDLSAAFDTLKHKILIQRLIESGFCGKALDWLKSYISDRMSRVSIGDYSSEYQKMTHGVPQGSVLGPLLFSIYLSPVFKIFANQPLIKFHSYADDIHIFTDADNENDSSAHIRLQNCLRELSIWFHENSLQLNPLKTEVMYVNHTSKHFSTSFTFSFDKCLLSSSQTIKNLGVILKSNHDMKSFISEKIRSVNFQLYRIKKIRKSLNFFTCKILVTSLVLGVFDNCNVLLIGLPAITLAELTSLQRYAVRIIHKLPHREENNHISITQLMKELHWLPIKERIIYKIFLMTHNALHFETPSYLYELIERIDQTRSLRPCHVNRIRPRSTIHSTAARSRAFSSQAPIAWNSLPATPRAERNSEKFKKNLKTYLFTL